MSADRIIRTYLLIAGIYTLAASLIWGVNTLFLLGAGLDIGGVFIANAAFSAGMVLFELPTGVVADTVGRRASFLLSVAVLGLSTLAYVAIATRGGGLLAFSAVSVFMGLGFTFYSGAVEAWLVDALAAVRYDKELDRVFALGAIVSAGAMLLGTIGGGLIGSINLSFPYLARSALLVLAFVVAFFAMRDIGYSRRALTLGELPGEMRAVLDASLNHGWQRRPVRLLMLTSLVLGVLYTWAFYAWQPYFLELLGRPDAVWAAGLISALIALATMAGNGLVERLSRFCGKRTTLLLWAAVAISVSTLVVGLSVSFFPAVIAFLVTMAATGVTEPVKQAFIHKLIPSGQRATIISFDSMFDNTGSTFGQIGLGYVAQQRSIAAGYLVGGLLTFLALPLLVRLRKASSPADLIVGRAGTISGCAAQGLPEISGIDSDSATDVSLQEKGSD